MANVALLPSGTTATARRSEIPNPGAAPIAISNSFTGPKASITMSALALEKRGAVEPWDKLNSIDF